MSEKKTSNARPIGNMRIRLASIANLPRMVDLCEQLRRITEGKPLDRTACARGFEAILRHQGLSSLVADFDGHVIGMLVVSGEVISTFRGRRIWIIGDVITDEPFEGTGVFSVLLEELCRRAAAEGVEELELIVAEGNEHAQAIYEHLGFQMPAYRIMRMRVRDLRSMERREAEPATA